MKVKMKPVGSIKLSLGINENGRIQKFFTDTCARYMDKYIPKDEGNLRRIKERGSNYIKYNQRYAHYQYVNQFPEDHYTTPGTGPYWDRRMVSAEMDQVVKEVQKEIKKHGN